MINEYGRKFSPNSAEAFRYLFGNTSADEINRLPIKSKPKAHVAQIWRNQGLERVVGLAQKLLGYLEVDWDIKLSVFDDSLAFEEFEDAGLHIIWTDSARYVLGEAAFEDFLVDRAGALRKLSDSPIFVVDQTGSLDGKKFQMVGANLMPLRRTFELLGTELFDERWVKVLGTRLNPHLDVDLGRWLALRVICNYLSKPIKLVALDLDGTLYSGVLGEDGIEGLSLATGHLGIHRVITYLQEAGVFTTLISKNDERDVVELFQAWSETLPPLTKFQFPKFGWERKSEYLERICSSLEIGMDSVIFVDDNPAELTEMQTSVPVVQTVSADSDGYSTLRALCFTPGLWPLSQISSTARFADLNSRKRREELKSLKPESNYLDELEMKAYLSKDNPLDIDRAAELSAKTNQFNLSLSRLSHSELRNYVNRPDSFLVLGGLVDRFADIGQVLSIAFTVENGRATVEELCLSCRALGRNIETKLVVKCLQFACGDTLRELHFRVRKGPRNEPALRWLEQFGRIPTGENASYLIVDWSALEENLTKGPRLGTIER